MDYKNEIEVNRMAAIHAKVHGQTLDNEEQQALDKFHNQHDLEKVPFNKEWIQQIEGHIQNAESAYASLQDKLRSAENTPVSRVFKLRKILAYAACLLVGVGICAWAIFTIFISNQKQWPFSEGSDIPHDRINGASAGAILFLKNRQPIELDSGVRGVIASDNGVSIINPYNGMLTYHSDGTSKEKSTNMLITRRGNTYRVRLPDSSMMYLNAETTVSYPSSFNGDIREVNLVAGEAYFDIVKDTRPFVVKTDKYPIRVLGTKFNVNMYNDEGITRTTLVSGAIQLNNDQMLKSGQQAVTYSNSKAIKVLTNVDTVSATSWKDGVLNFKNATLLTIMKQIERWYDVKVVVAQEIQEDLITMTNVGPTVDLYEFMKLLTYNERYHCTINAKTKEVIITK